MILLAAPIVAVAHELCKGIDVRFIAIFNFLGFAFTLDVIRSRVSLNRPLPRPILNPRNSKRGRVHDRGGAFDARPRPHADFHSAEIFGGGGDRLHEGQEFDLDCAECRAQGAQFHRAQILGSRLFRFDGRDEETIRAYIKNQELQEIWKWISFP